MSEYNDLQTQAAELGMPAVVGKSTQELKDFIQSAKSAKPPKQETPKPPESDDNESDESKKKNTPKAKAFNAAVVLSGTQEIRRYTLEIHGKKFEQLANSFVEKHGQYTVKLINSEPPIECPKCGHKFDL